MEKQKLREKTAWVFTMGVLPVLITGVVRALAIYVFVTPNNFAPGGINGLSVLLEYLCGQAGLHVSWGWFLLAFSVPLFFLAFFLVGKREAIVSTGSMLLSSGLGILFDEIEGFPQFFAPPGSEPIAYGIMAAVASGILLGIPLAVLLRCCNTAGGTSIIASVIHRKWKQMSINWMTFIFDAIVVVSSFFVYFKWGEPFADNFAVNLMPVLLALVSLYVTSKVTDVILHGLQTAYKFQIITDHPDELAKEIMEKTHHGVTLMHATGMYSHTEKSMLVCLVRKRNIAQVQRIIKQYPDTFAYFDSASEVYGKFVR